MKAITYVLFVSLQLTYILGSPLVVQYKCWLWDSSCLTATAQRVVPILTEGIPALGTERLDTMFISGFHVDQDGYRADYSNTYVQGLKNTIIDNIRVDTNSKVLRLLFHSDLSVRSNYVHDGYLLSMPISGQGEVNMKLKNIQVEFVIPFEIVKDFHGRDIMDLKGYQYSYDVRDGANLNFGNLYYGNLQLGQRMNALINQNWKRLTTQFGRNLFDRVNDKVFNAIRNYLHARPLDAISLY